MSESLRVFAPSSISYNPKVPSGLSGILGLNPDGPNISLIIPSLSMTSFADLAKKYVMSAVTREVGCGNSIARAPNPELENSPAESITDLKSK